MKNIYSFIFFLLLTSAVSAQLYYTNLNINDVYFADANTGYCCAKAGTIRKTTDGGQTWQLLHSRVYFNLNTVFFTSPTTGFAGGEYGTLIKTTDGGVTWNKSFFDSSGLAKVVDMYFINSTTGFLLADRLYKTTDGGNSWQKINNSYYGGTQLVVLSTSTLLVNLGSGSSVARSTDGGSTWTFVLNGYDGLAFSGQTGFAYSKYNYAFTSNGGASWTTKSATHSFRSVVFYDAINGMGVDTGGTIYKTVDGGQNWTLLIGGRRSNLNSIVMTSLSKAITVGDDAAIRITADGGGTWKTISETYARWNRALQYVDDQVIYVVGQSGKVIKSMDAGVTWLEQYLGPYKIYDNDCLFFLNRDTGYIGNGNHIFKTSNGGTTWKIDSIGTISNEISKLHFANPDTGVGVGNYGFIIRTINGGASWTRITVTNLFDDLNDVLFLNDTVVIATGPTHNYLRSTDAGLTWKKDSLYDAGEFLDFPTQDTGYMAGTYFYRTIDKGNTWTKISNSIKGCACNSIKFVNGKIGYAGNCTPGTPYLYKTSDAGMTWSWPFKHALFNTAFTGVAPSPDGKRLIVMCEDGWVLTSFDTITVTVGVNEIDAANNNVNNQFQAVPNPFSIQTQIHFERQLKDASISMYNTIGQKVKTITGIRGDVATIIGEGLHSGLYIFTVDDEDVRVGSGKFVVE